MYICIYIFGNQHIYMHQKAHAAHNTASITWHVRTYHSAVPMHPSTKKFAPNFSLASAAAFLVLVKIWSSKRLEAFFTAMCIWPFIYKAFRSVLCVVRVTLSFADSGIWARMLHVQPLCPCSCQCVYACVWMQAFNDLKTWYILYTKVNACVHLVIFHTKRKIKK